MKIPAKILACWALCVCFLVPFDAPATTAFDQQSHGRFVAIGSMAEARVGHTATLLTDGRVLIAGGATRTGTLASAELYDPATRTFVRTGNMHSPRVGFTATLLESGKVLIAGGFVTLDVRSYLGRTALATAELYDPAKGTFEITGTMMSPHAAHSATLLPSGKVLIVGGVQGNGVLLFPYPNVLDLATFELYDPDTGKFSPPGSIPTFLDWRPRATLLKNGDVLIISAMVHSVHPGGDFYNIAQLYSPKDATLTAIQSDGLGAYASGVATLLSDGKVLITGGLGPGLLAPNDGALLYDPAHPGFQPTGKMETGRIGHTATCLPNGRVLVTGGAFARRPFASAELYDPGRAVFTSTSDMTTRRTGHKATLLRTGEVLITGGIGDSYASLASAELYIPEGVSAPVYTKASQVSK